MINRNASKEQFVELEKIENALDNYINNENC